MKSKSNVIKFFKNSSIISNSIDNKSRIFYPNAAFTISEVLITLGIIGILASLTIPPLIQNINDLAHKAAAKKAFSVASQAILSMQLDEGENLLDYYATVGGVPVVHSFKDSFKNYFKSVVKDYNLSAEQAKIEILYKYNYRSLSGQTLNSEYFNDGQFITSDGMLWMMEQSDFILISVDVNGFKKPNQLGKDIFTFQLLKNNKLVPEGASFTRFPYPNTDLCLKDSPNINQGISCMYYVMQGIDY